MSGGGGGGCQEQSGGTQFYVLLLRPQFHKQACVHSVHTLSHDIEGFVQLT